MFSLQNPATLVVGSSQTEEELAKQETEAAEGEETAVDEEGGEGESVEPRSTPEG